MTGLATLMTKEYAEEIADQLNSEENEELEDWSYVPEHSKAGMSKVAIYDEGREFVGYL